MPTVDHTIDPNGVYSVRSFARSIGSGPQSVYRAIERKQLRAAVINDRGDLRILGAWGIEFLSARADNKTEQAVA